jgi:hypothetical protein
MSSNYARYDSPANAPDTTPATAQEREELHRQLTA